MRFADWVAVAVTAAAFALLIVVIGIGRAWPGSEVVLVLALLGGGLGVALLLARHEPVADVDETEVAEQ